MGSVLLEPLKKLIKKAFGLIKVVLFYFLAFIKYFTNFAYYIDALLHYFKGSTRVSLIVI